TRGPLWSTYPRLAGIRHCLRRRRHAHRSDIRGECDIAGAALSKPHDLTPKAGMTATPKRLQAFRRRRRLFTSHRAVRLSSILRRSLVAEMYGSAGMTLQRDRT